MNINIQDNEIISDERFEEIARLLEAHGVTFRELLIIVKAFSIHRYRNGLNQVNPEEVFARNGLHIINNLPVAFKSSVEEIINDSEYNLQNKPLISLLMMVAAQAMKFDYAEALDEQNNR